MTGRALRRALALLFAIGGIPAFDAAAATSAVPRCTAPPALIRFTAPLPHAANRMRRQGLLRIVAIGSSSTSGVGASSPTHAYPARLAVLLASRLPGGRVEIFNKGVGGETAVDMLGRFDRDVFPLHPDLVVWQVGTNAVVRGDDLSHYDVVLRQGIKRLKAAGIDIIVMDPQYAPPVLAAAGHADLERRLEAIGRDTDVPLFHRFAIMRYLHEAAQVDFGAMLAPDSLHMNDFGYDCMARLLADAIVGTAARPVATNAALRQARRPAGFPVLEDARDGEH
jgi:lysophospholipase L1-like esterase